MGLANWQDWSLWEPARADLDRLNNETRELEDRIESVDTQLLSLEESENFSWDRFEDHLPKIANLLKNNHLELLKPLLMALFDCIEVTPPDNEGIIKLNFIVKGTGPRFPTEKMVCGREELVEVM